MPALFEGVMLVATMSPTGVGTTTPPANGFPPGAVWHAVQSAAMARYSPRSIVAAPGAFDAGWAMAHVEANATTARAGRHRTHVMLFPGACGRPPRPRLFQNVRDRAQRERDGILGGIAGAARRDDAGARA